MAIYVNERGYISSNKSDHRRVIYVNLSLPLKEEALESIFGCLEHAASRNEKCAFLIKDGNVVAYNNGRGWEMKSHPHAMVETKIMKYAGKVFGKTPTGIKNDGNRQWRVYYDEDEEVGNGKLPGGRVQAMLEFYA